MTNYSNVSMLCIPPAYPKSITDITDPNEQNIYKERYTVAYNQEFEKYDQQWDGLKASMYGVSLIAVGVFATIMIATAPVSLPLIVASIIATSLIGGTAAICTMTYYGYKAEQNDRNIREMPTKFPIKYDIEFRREQIMRQLYATQPPPSYAPSAPQLYPQLES